LADPHSSLMLRKPTAEVAHEGGQRLVPKGEMYETLVRWIAAKTPDDPKDLRTLTGIEIMPSEIVLRSTTPAPAQQLLVRARYSDGRQRDVTSLAVYTSTDDSTAVIAPDGVVTAKLPGEAFIMARFGTFAVVTQVIVRSAAAGPFVWPNTPSNNYIDDAIYAKLKKLQILPSGLCSDEVFLRRVYLDILGVLPTAEGYSRFMADQAADKRSKLIDLLLARPEFPELWAMKSAELLRIESASRRISHKAMYLYSTWLRDSILGNKPMDEMVRELLTAEGGN